VALLLWPCLAVLAGCPTREVDPLLPWPGTGSTLDRGSPLPYRTGVILMIGDGMGRAHLDVASLYATGARDALYLHTLPHRGNIQTRSLSGTTDSAAAATTMATGRLTSNGRIGQDAAGNDLETVVELAHAEGLAAGAVTTSTVTHATPGGFTAHVASRADEPAIADDQILAVQPELLLGGGAQFFLSGPGSQRSDRGLDHAMKQAGYRLITHRGELAGVREIAEPRLIGLFAPGHLDYTLERAPGTGQPTLVEMSRAALDFLDRHPAGFFLLIEGARIDMASHGNRLDLMVAELLAFDETVAEVEAWARSRPWVTVLVTADHECGGLNLLGETAAGTLPAAHWNSTGHSDADVDLLGLGPASETIDGASGDHTTTYRLIADSLRQRRAAE
jgi:alkaline phosphatase